LYEHRYKWEKEVRITILGVEIAESAVQLEMFTASNESKQ